MGDFVQFIINRVCQIFSPNWAVFFISVIPVLELRGGLIAASLLNIDWKVATAVCITGNMIPVPFILLFAKKILDNIRNSKFAHWAKIIDGKVAKSRRKILKYQQVGLYLFVAIPLPGTGAWTAALVAAFLGTDLKKAFISIFLGVITAGIIMNAVSYGIVGNVVSELF